MDIVVGGISAVQVGDRGADQLSVPVVEGTVLSVRAPRGTRSARDVRREPYENQRRGKDARRVDPPGSKVLTLLIVDPTGIPPDIGTVPYRVVIRFIHTL